MYVKKNDKAVTSRYLDNEDNGYLDPIDNERFCKAPPYAHLMRVTTRYSCRGVSKLFKPSEEARIELNCLTLHTSRIERTELAQEAQLELNIY